jgi:hypothetical protein
MAVFKWAYLLARGDDIQNGLRDFLDQIIEFYRALLGGFSWH